MKKSVIKSKKGRDYDDDDEYDEDEDWDDEDEDWDEDDEE